MRSRTFNEIQKRVPHLADLKPSGKYVFQDLYNVGGVPAVQKYLLDNGLLHGDCLTVTGKTLAENLENMGTFGGRPRRDHDA